MSGLPAHLLVTGDALVIHRQELGRKYSLYHCNHRVYCTTMGQTPKILRGSPRLSVFDLACHPNSEVLLYPLLPTWSLSEVPVPCWFLHKSDMSQKFQQKVPLDSPNLHPILVTGSFPYSSFLIPFPIFICLQGL